MSAQEIRSSRVLSAQIAERATKLVKAIEVETREGLDADWTEIAELFDSIRDLAEHGAACAWRVSYEDAACDEEVTATG